MSTQENKEIAISWLQGMYDRDGHWRSMLHEDFRYWALGRWQDRPAFVETVEAHPGGQYSLKIGSVTAEDDRVVIEAEPSYDLPDGRNYTNFYLFSVQIRDRRIFRYKAHNDTLHAYRIFANEAIWVEPALRESPFDSVLKTLGGPTPQPGGDRLIDASLTTVEAGSAAPREARDLAVSWLEAGLGGDFDLWSSMLDEDFRYWYCGKWRDRAGYLKVAEGMQGFVQGDYSMQIGSITAEDDRVVIEWETNYDLQNGGHYRNFYVAIFRFRGGRILRYLAHNDTLIAQRVLGGRDENWVEPDARRSPLEDVTRTIVGPPTQVATA